MAATRLTSSYFGRVEMTVRSIGLLLLGLRPLSPLHRFLRRSLGSEARVSVIEPALPFASR